MNFKHLAQRTVEQTAKGILPLTETIKFLEQGIEPSNSDYTPASGNRPPATMIFLIRGNPAILNVKPSQPPSHPGTQEPDFYSLKQKWIKHSDSSWIEIERGRHLTYSLAYTDAVVAHFFRCG